MNIGGTMSTQPAWRKSSRSAAQGQCVEAAALPGLTVGIRDSKNPGAGHLTVTAGTWTALLTGIKAGRHT